MPVIGWENLENYFYFQMIFSLTTNFTFFSFAVKYICTFILHRQYKIQISYWTYQKQSFLYEMTHRWGVGYTGRKWSALLLRWVGDKWQECNILQAMRFIWQNLRGWLCVGGGMMSCSILNWPTGEGWGILVYNDLSYSWQECSVVYDMRFIWQNLRGWRMVGWGKMSYFIWIDMQVRCGV